MDKTMNHIKEVLEEKGSNRHGLPTSSERASVLLTHTCATGDNQVWKSCFR